MKESEEYKIKPKYIKKRWTKWLTYCRDMERDHFWFSDIGSYISKTRYQIRWRSETDEYEEANKNKNTYWRVISNRLLSSLIAQSPET